MGDIVQSINALNNMLPLKAATESEVTDAELQLRLNFAEEYKMYLLSFGAVLADGIEMTGIARSEHRNVVAVTKQEWGLNTNVPHTMYVIERIGIDGIIVWQDSSGAIYQTAPNQSPKKISNNLAAYVAEKSK